MGDAHRAQQGGLENRNGAGTARRENSGFEAIKPHPCRWICSFSRFSLGLLGLKTAPASWRGNMKERQDLSGAERVLISFPEAAPGMFCWDIKGKMGFEEDLLLPWAFWPFHDFRGRGGGGGGGKSSIPKVGHAGTSQTHPGHSAQCWTGSPQGFWDFPVPRARKSHLEEPQLPDFLGLELELWGWSCGGPGTSPGGVPRIFPGEQRCSQGISPDHGELGGILLEFLRNSS